MNSFKDFHCVSQSAFVRRLDVLSACLVLQSRDAHIAGRVNIEGA